MSDMQKKYFRCQCYYERNYYIAKYDVHLEYKGDDDSFLKTHNELLEQKGCTNTKDKEDVLKQLRLEKKRRQNVDTESDNRINKIRSNYTPLHREAYILKEEYLNTEFLEAVKHAKERGSTLSSLVAMLKKDGPHIFRMPVFTKAFCTMILEELEHFEASDMPKGRPNTMNNGGILLGEIGFNECFITPLRENYLNPLAKILFPEWVGESLDSHKAFTVKYKESEDLSLGFHYDNAEVTMNISLGKDFDDGSLYFGSMRQDKSTPGNAIEVKHKVGEGVFHRGRHKHGAMPISWGERINFIIWMRSSSIRNKLCPMCDNPPVLSKSLGYGDGFIEGKTSEIEMCTTL